MNTEKNLPNVAPDFIELKDYSEFRDGVRLTAEFFHLMQKRRTIRSFETTEVNREIVMNAVRAAGTAPNGANSQPWFFAVIESPLIKEKIRIEAEKVERAFYFERASKEFLADLAPLGTTSEKKYLSEAPVLIAVFARIRAPESTTDAGSAESPKSYYPMESTGIAVGILLTALHQAGLATLTHTPKPMHFLNEILGLDRCFRPFVLVVTGYPKIPVRVPNIRRKNLSEICKLY